MSLIILQWMINSLAIVIAVRIIDGISFYGPWWHMLIIGSLFGIINSLVRPIIRIFSIPFIILTLGIFTLVINTAMLGLTILISRQLELGLDVTGFWPAFWGALIVSIVSSFLSWILGVRKLRAKLRGGRNA